MLYNVGRTIKQGGAETWLNLKATPEVNKVRNDLLIRILPFCLIAALILLAVFFIVRLVKAGTHGKPNEKAIPIKMLTSTLALAITVLILGLLVRLVINMDSIAVIRPQHLIAETVSPDERYTVKFYLNNGGATTAYAVLGQMTDHMKGQKKNIYWQYREETVAVKWLNTQTLEINGKILTLPDDVYDYRKQDKP